VEKVFGCAFIVVLRFEIDRAGTRGFDRLSGRRCCGIADRAWPRIAIQRAAPLGGEPRIISLVRDEAMNAPIACARRR
jgi:hypothetical protein